MRFGAQPFQALDSIQYLNKDDNDDLDGDHGNSPRKRGIQRMLLLTSHAYVAHYEIPRKKEIIFVIEIG